MYIFRQLLLILIAQINILYLLNGCHHLWELVLLDSGNAYKMHCSLCVQHKILMGEVYNLSSLSLCIRYSVYQNLPELIHQSFHCHSNYLLILFGESLKQGV